MTILRTILATIIILLLAWSAWTCRDTISGPELSQIVFPATKVSYSGQVQPLFDRGCGGQSNACHGPDTFSMFLFSLSSYEDVVASNTLVHPGDTVGSELILCITGKVSPKMPPSDQPQLNDNQIKGIRQWILEGAQNN